MLKLQRFVLFYLAGTFACIVGVSVSEDSLNCPTGYTFNTEVKRIINKKYLSILICLFFLTVIMIKHFVRIISVTSLKRFQKDGLMQDETA